MNDFWTSFDNMVWNLTHRLGIVDIVDIVIMALIFYELLILLRRTRSSALLKGLFLLLVIVAVSSLLGLTSLNWLLTTLLNNGAVVLIVLFQPEIRKGLEKMGRSSLLRKGADGTEDMDRQERIASEIVQTLLDLSHRRVGALICIEQRTGLQDVIDTGTRVDGEISAPLLENIFEPNTPLHDGAVVIRDGRVEAAACILPLTEASGVSRELGTRHRAGIGLSEISDAVVLIVSEETGTISMARGGMLRRPLTEENLRQILREFYASDSSWLVSFWNRLRRDRKGAEA
ncbi:MAG: diadenylate cyclase CdaA [Clostridia bacterium]|nr:diadenylate cyclase CdaA [Clostridia bacterium]